MPVESGTRLSWASHENRQITHGVQVCALSRAFGVDIIATYFLCLETTLEAAHIFTLLAVPQRAMADQYLQGTT